MNHRRRRQNRGLLRIPLPLALVVGWSAGCRDHEEIVRYTVQRESRRAVDPHGAHEPSEEATTVGPQGATSLLAALVPRGGDTWFFKLSGPTGSVSEQKARFRRLVESVRFPEGAIGPSWDDPEGWRREAGAGMRYATLIIDGDSGPLEVTVTPLKTSEGAYRDYVLANVNRWREQIGLDPTEGSALFGPGGVEGGLIESKLAGGETVYLVELEGRGEGPPSGSTPGTASGPGMRAEAAVERARPREAPFAFEAPPGWSVRDASGMRLAAFDVAHEGRKAEVTVIALAESAGDLLANINRWRGQIGLDPVSLDQLDSQLEPIELSGTPARLVALEGEAGDASAQSILGAIGTHGGRIWFIKMMGDPGLVDQERERFETFVRSIRFRGSSGGGDGQ